MIKVVRVYAAEEQALARLRRGGLRVHSVFRRAINLESPEGRWVTLLSQPARGPGRAHLGALGALASLRAGEALQSARLDTRELEVYTLPPPLPLSGLRTLAPGALLQLRGLVAESRAQQPAGPGEALARRRLQELLARSLSVDSKQVQGGVARSGALGCARLLGLGEGLTPAGDDLLLGLLAALAHLDGHFATALRAALAREAPSQLSRTTDAGRQQLLEALDGRFPLVLSELLRALATGSPFEGPALELLGFGASSGRCILEGLVEGVERAQGRSR